MQKRYDILKPRVRAPGKRFLRLFAGTQGFFRAIFARHAFMFAGWSALALDYFFRRSEAGTESARIKASSSPGGGIRLSPVIKLYYNRIGRPDAPDGAPEQAARGMGSTKPLRVFGTRLEQLILRTPAVLADGSTTTVHSPQQGLAHATTAAPLRVRDIIRDKSDLSVAAQTETSARDGNDELILRPVTHDRIVDSGKVANNPARRQLRIFTLPHVSVAADFPDLVSAPGPISAGPISATSQPHATPLPLTYRQREASPRPPVGSDPASSSAVREPVARVYDGVRQAPATLSAPTGDYARDAAASENFARALRELPSREVEGLAARIYSHLERKISRDLDRRGLS